MSVHRGVHGPGEVVHGSGGCMVLGGCVHGPGGCVHGPGGVHAPRGDPWSGGLHVPGGVPGGDPTTATAANGTHLTGMHSCLVNFYSTHIPNNSLHSTNSTKF